MDRRFNELKGRLITRFDRIDTNIEELRSMMISRFSVASGGGAPVHTPIPDPDPYAAGSSEFQPQYYDQRTPILNFDDEEPMQDAQIDSDQGTEILHLSDEDGGD